mmetsp:Transcript_5216/g.14049  ORF Transcript_5216/g.14049 Transcript_5216/m.14049 type:complete len:98 (+) Transcript_5216:1196-1489(+)
MQTCVRPTDEIPTLTLPMSASTSNMAISSIQPNKTVIVVSTAVIMTASTMISFPRSRSAHETAEIGCAIQPSDEDREFGNAAGDVGRDLSVPQRYRR